MRKYPSAARFFGLVVVLLASVATFAAGPATEPATGNSAQNALRENSTINGLVVFAQADGRIYGKAIEIIASAPKSQAQLVPGVIPVGTIGPEMRTSLEEAVRLAKQRNPKVGDVRLEISFGEKYSAKDGGSAGAAMALLILSSFKEFDLDPSAAMTGDITVDGKIRAVAAVRAKVHGAALDHMAVVGIPSENAKDLDEAALLDGPGLLWDTQIVGLDTVDDAIALMRKDRAPKLTEALKLFDKLRSDMAAKPVAELAGNAEAQAALARILELAPNHLSAAALQRVAQNKGPQKLSARGSLEAFITALGPTRNDVLSNAPGTGYPVTPDDIESTKKDVAKLNDLVDPSFKDLLSSAQSYFDATGKYLSAERSQKRIARPDYQAKRTALREAILKLLGDKDTAEKLIHGD